MSRTKFRLAQRRHTSSLQLLVLGDLPSAEPANQLKKNNERIQGERTQTLLCYGLLFYLHCRTLCLAQQHLPIYLLAQRQLLYDSEGALRQAPQTRGIQQGHRQVANEANLYNPTSRPLRSLLPIIVIAQKLDLALSLSFVVEYSCCGRTTLPRNAIYIQYLDRML